MKKPIVKSRSQKIYDILENHNEFKHEFSISRKRFLKTAKESIGKDGSKYLSQWNSKVLEEETSRIMSTFASIPASWEECIKEYIKTGILTPPASSTKPKVSLKIVTPSNQSYLTVQVFKHTTRKEYVDAWKNIESLKQGMWEIDPPSLSKKEIAIIKARQAEENKKDWEISRDLPFYASPGAIRKTISRKARSLGVTVKRKKTSHKSQS